jgi:hypothetical protein
MIGSSRVHKAHWFLRYSLMLVGCLLVRQIPITGSWPLDIGLLLVAADFFGLLNLNGWGGKRRNWAGELTP